MSQHFKSLLCKIKILSIFFLFIAYFFNIIYYPECMLLLNSYLLKFIYFCIKKRTSDYQNVLFSYMDLYLIFQDNVLPFFSSYFSIFSMSGFLLSILERSINIHCLHYVIDEHMIFLIGYASYLELLDKTRRQSIKHNAQLSSQLNWYSH